KQRRASLNKPGALNCFLKLGSFISISTHTLIMDGIILDFQKKFTKRIFLILGNLLF
ncbi:MAG: hypothetical protein BECKG1743E_GA0114224_110291, partial [Candidatus Kentron sp. G]